MSDTTKAKSEEAKVADSEVAETTEASSSTNAADAAVVEKLTADKIAAEQRAKDLEKKLAAMREDSKKRDEEVDAVKKSLEEIKRKTMSKEELELQERKELQETLSKKDELIEQLKQEANAANLNATRLLIAQEEGVPAPMIKFLRGANENEIRDEAKELLDNIKKASGKTTVTTNKVTEVGSTTTANTDSAGQVGQSGAKAPFKGTLKELREELVKRNFDPKSYIKNQG